MYFFALLFTTLTTLPALLNAAFIPHTALCGDNLTCRHVCFKGMFHVQQSGHDELQTSYLGCAITKKYDHFVVGTLEGAEIDTATARDVCHAGAGRYCAKGCVLMNGRRFLDWYHDAAKFVGMTPKQGQDRGYGDALKEAEC